MTDYTELLTSGALYLRLHARCPKHKIEHTGSTAYLLDFYAAQGAIQEGKKLTETLLDRIVSDNGHKVFYPGRLHPMNMSNSVIDSGAAVDAIARFATMHQEAFSNEEHVHIVETLRGVMDTYLTDAAVDKPITNQRLWGLTGVASFARYVGEEEQYRAQAAASIERAFSDMTTDGFFRYYPDAPRHHAFSGYDGMTEFYQSRHIAFIVYALDTLGMPRAPYQERLDQATRALLSMYTSEGYKDLRMECKRWYWQSPYEVASHGFDAYALAASTLPEAKAALHNVLYLIRTHFRGGHLRSDGGPDINFQCPIFWTAHLGWMLRISDCKGHVDAASALVPFRYEFSGERTYTFSAPGTRILVNGHWQARNPTVGIFDYGLPDVGFWRLRPPSLPPSLGFSFREVLNHSWYALRGGHFLEAAIRLARYAWALCLMLIPYYSTRYGKVERVTYDEREGRRIVKVVVHPASRYGTLLPDTHTFILTPYA